MTWLQQIGDKVQRTSAYFREGVFTKTLTSVIQTLRREKVFVLFAAIALLVLLGALGFSLAEPYRGPWYARFGRGVWWAAVTLTTVGYGDVVPVTFWGRVVGISLMAGGLLSLALLTATVASIFVERKFRRERGLEPITCTEHILILGWHFDAEILVDQLVRRLPESQCIVLVNKCPPEQLEALKEKYHNYELHYLYGDFSREEILLRANVTKALKAVILADRPVGETAGQVDQRTLLTALTLKSLNTKIRLLAELLSPENRSYLERAGVEQVIIRGQYDSSFLAGAMATPGLFRIFTSLLTGDNQNLWAVAIPSRFQNRTVGELAAYLKERHQALLIGLYSEGRVRSLDELLSDESSPIDDFVRRKFAEAGMTHLFGRTKVEFQVNPPENLVLGVQQYAAVIAPQRPSL